ncbi:putative unusual protein kinase regulating ubiquinone biosynthesis (AarF/ABC1/UbiB family) [Sphingomonas sp. SORGH_AS802]|uniref:ABC1 kinase family protein n=1 Tax=unclassified Sphingomonas TaxID=196159 RepID=UPI0028596DE9|nr:MULTISPECIES: AarF/ABC1/UbiB kinase family protein [unclassified Sphingomonas]MDR6126606.1 putative unusual protein kinase regulating ubiquinone biosynthesis (AarF/ABC1/UbiB family) [Sphingomonas sp. SORGH_AS_0438]MDR6135026.1 putative unusual protein kinase regulating ubiquinone biosynthesis (AarF/ABC1/UbiB family) [Sphingomonas sp. SORGH_AS_0802]
MQQDDDAPNARHRAIPSGRAARLGVFGRLAGGVAGGMIAEGARRLAAGERPRMSDLVLTPANATRVADRLSHLRGAAMKLGQMISMDAGDMLPAELSTILARLRNQAYRMPPTQLDQVLTREWGTGWRRRFRHFEAAPIAAASIGQVHRATLSDGRVLAIKVQYPGVADSIDADVDNVATLLRVSNLLPSTLDLKPLLAEAKRQLAEEADYVREGEQMRRYGERLAGDPRYVVPTLEEGLTTGRVLAMSFVEGRPIETLADAEQGVRDTAMTALVSLVLRELFDFATMQTDPNFANYRWQPESGALVLLDFGATRAVPAETADSYRRLIVAGLARNRDAIRDVAVETGFLGAVAADTYRPAIDRIIAAIDDALNRPGSFDFGDRAFVPVVREEAKALIADRATWHVPHVETLFVQRKVSGTALLAARLKARVDVRGLAASAIGAA